MARLFLFAVECGRADVAHSLGKLYRGAVTLPGGTSANYEAEESEDLEGNWWITVGASGVSASGARDEEEARQLGALAKHWYKLLERPDASFRCALAGLEVEKFAAYSDVASGRLLAAAPRGLVLDESLWRVAGGTGPFVPFKPGYVWNPYRGESIWKNGAWVVVPP